MGLDSHRRPFFGPRGRFPVRTRETELYPDKLARRKRRPGHRGRSAPSELGGPGGGAPGVGAPSSSSPGLDSSPVFESACSAGRFVKH